MEMETFIKVSGRTDRLREWVHLQIPKAVYLKVSGLKISSMEKELNIGTTTRSNMKVTLYMERSLDRESFHVMVALILENLLMECFMVKANTTFLIQARFIKDFLKKISLVEWEK